MPITIESSRQLVLSRLGTPTPLLPGEKYRHRSSELPQIYERYGRYIDEALMDDRPEEALESFVAFLEAKRERDYDAFHYGRELLLADLNIHVECPSGDPEPDPCAPSPAVAEPEPEPARKLPRWSLRKRASGKGKGGPAQPQQLRAKVIARLGRPHGYLPGEGAVLQSSRALDEVRAYFDEFEYRGISEEQVNEAIERLSPLRARDWQAFCFGRSELLSLLPIEFELPAPASA